jgi:predicted aspartyl protease
MSTPRTGRRRRLWAAGITVPLLLVASCTGSGAESSPAPTAPVASHGGPPASAPGPSAAASAPASLPPGAFTSKLRIPSFTGNCPATTAPSASGNTVVIPLHIQTPSAVISQLFVGVCLNGHGPYPFIIDTGSTHTYVDVALASQLNLISAAVATRLRSATCNGPEQEATARLSVGPYVFAQDREVIVANMASPSAPLMGILGAAELSRLGIDRIDYQAQTLTVPAPAAHSAALASLSAGTVHRIGLHPSGGFLLMPATAGSARGELLLDTGAQGTTLTPAFARQARLAKASSVTTQTYAGLGCTRPVTYYATATWSVGGVALAPQTVGVVPDFLVADGSLGSGTLQRYTPVVIDYRDEELLLGSLSPGA